MNASERVSRSNLRQGAIYMMVGLLWGMVVPETPFPRLALGAHLQLTGHSVMFLVAGLVILRLGLGQGRASRVILLAAPWLTWPQMLSAMANAWWGAHNILPLAAKGGRNNRSTASNQTCNITPGLSHGLCGWRCRRQPVNTVCSETCGAPRSCGACGGRDVRLQS